MGNLQTYLQLTLGQWAQLKFTLVPRAKGLIPYYSIAPSQDGSLSFTGG